MPFEVHKTILFSRKNNKKKICVPTLPKIYRPVTRNTLIFLFGLIMLVYLNRKYQQRLPYDLLSALSNALLDGTVFQIVNGLKEVQQWEERTMFGQRSKLVSDHKGNSLPLKGFANECRGFLCSQGPSGF